MLDYYRNKAFISYSSKDEEIAKRLQKELEEIVIPTGICKFSKLEKDRLGKFFRDRTDLQAGCSLTESLKHELDNTEWLIVICSDNVRSSTWVDKEISYFSELPNRVNRIIPFVSYLTSFDKNIIDCFPCELIRINERKHDDILAADSRHRKDGWNRSVAKTIARLLDINLDDWIQRLQYDLEIKKYHQLIDDARIKIDINNFTEAQSELIRYINEEHTFNLANIELKFLLKRCNINIGSFCIEQEISAIDYNNSIIVIGTINGDIIFLDMLYGIKRMSFKAHSESISSVNILEKDIVLTRASNIDNITIKLWRVYDEKQLIWKICHPISFPEYIMNNENFKIFKNFLIPFRGSNIAITPDKKNIAFSIGGYVAVADIKTSKIFYYVEMPQPIQIIPHVNFINQIIFDSKLNYGAAISSNQTVYWDIITGNISDELTDSEKKALERVHIENNKSNLFDLTTDNNKIEIFERKKLQTLDRSIKFFINKKSCNFLISEDNLIIQNDCTKEIYRIKKNTCAFLINFHATISECGNYLGIFKPSNMSEPGDIDIYSVNNGEFLVNFKIKNIYTDKLFKMLTIYCIESYITNNLEVVSYISDNSIRVYRGDKEVAIYQVDIKKKPSKVVFYNKNILSVIYTDNSIYIWKYTDDKWVNTDSYAEENISCANFISEYIIALGSKDGYLILWKLDDHSMVKSHRIYPDRINCLSMTSDSERIILGCNKSIKIVAFNIYLEKIINLLNIEININPNNIYIDKNKILAIENNNALEVVCIGEIYSCEQEIIDEKFYRRKMLIEGDKNEMG